MENDFSSLIKDNTYLFDYIKIIFAHNNYYSEKEKELMVMNINYTTDEILAAIDECMSLKKGMRLTEDTFENFMNDRDSGIIEDYVHGASKLVIFLKDANFVVKIPFTGYMIDDGEYSDYCDNYYDFEGAIESAHSILFGVSEWLSRRLLG